MIVDLPPLPPILPSPIQKARICTNLMDVLLEAGGSGPLDPGPAAAPGWSKRLLLVGLKFSQSIIVTDDTLKVVYASVIFINLGVQVDEMQLGSLTTDALCYMQRY